MSFIDTGMFMQTFMLAAKDRGLNTCAQGAWNLFWVATRRIISIPENEYIIVGMALGDTNSGERVIAPREPLEQIATFHA